MKHERTDEDYKILKELGDKAKHRREAIWLVWVKKDRPNKAFLENVDLRAVCTNKERAELYRHMVKMEESDALAIWIEERETDHLYAQGDVVRAMRFSSHLNNYWEREKDS